MERLSNIVTAYLVRKNAITVEKSCIYQYGLQIGFEVCLNTFISIMIAVMCNMVIEAIVFFSTFILLRSYAGGLHLSTYFSCLVCSCASFLGLMLLVKYLNISDIISIGIIIGSFLCIKLLAPVQDINRPLSKDEEKKFGKKLVYTMILIGIASGIFYLCKWDKLLLTIAMTTLFMVLILVLGKIKYQICIRENE